jgi:hypothetical protein
MEKVAPQSRPEYERASKLVLRQDQDAVPIKAMTTLGVEKIYKVLLRGTPRRTPIIAH